MRISDWSSDVCSSDLIATLGQDGDQLDLRPALGNGRRERLSRLSLGLGLRREEQREARVARQIEEANARRQIGIGHAVASLRPGQAIVIIGGELLAIIIRHARYPAGGGLVPQPEGPRVGKEGVST